MKNIIKTTQTIKCGVYGGPESSTRSGLTEHIQIDKTKERH